MVLNTKNYNGLIIDKVAKYSIQSKFKEKLISI